MGVTAIDARVGTLAFIGLTVNFAEFRLEKLLPAVVTPEILI
jgi:hypothetical protein